MAKAFSERGKEIIEAQLLEAAAESIAKKGMQKTTVDELAAACHIAKGSFYNLYANKELLFWDVLLKWHDDIDSDMRYSFRNNRLSYIVFDNQYSYK